MIEKAVERIDRELKEFQGDQYEKVMKESVAEALKRLCRIEPEFARAVVEGGDFKGCMAAVRKAVKGNSLSDMDAYCAAAAYYFPGCKVTMQLSISMSGDINPDDAVSEKQDKPKGVMIDLTSFL